MNYLFNILEISDLQIAGPDPFASNAGRSSSAMSQGTTITLGPGAIWQPLTVSDDEGHLHDGDSSQVSVGAVTVNGTTYPSGSDIEVEYSYILRPIGATDASRDVVIYVIEFQGNVQAIASSGPMERGVTYRIQNGQGSDDPSVLYQDLYVCFAADMPIATPQGDRAVQDLRAGDLVLTADNGPQPIVWAGGRQVLAPVGRGPVTIRPGALGNGTMLRLSPQHRLVLRRGAAEVLVPVKALIDGAAITPARRPGLIAWHHLALERHEILFCGGAMVESLYPGEVSRQMLGPDLPGLQAVLPAFRTDAPDTAPARPLVRPGQWRRWGRQVA